MSCRGLVAARQLIRFSLDSMGLRRGVQVGRRFHSSYVEFHRHLLKQLWLAVDEVVHHDDIQVGRLQDSIARGDSHHKNAGCVKPDSQEGEASATIR